MRVVIRNFQSIREAVIEIDGFTALVGRSNIGKSASIRALKCALTGAEGTDFVRHDPKLCARLLKGNKKCTCYSEVVLHLADNTKVTWQKGDTLNQYLVEVEGSPTQTYSRVGKNPEMPPQLRGFEQIQLGSAPKEMLQVSDQFNPIFLLNVSGPTVAELLSDVAQLDDINKAMGLVTKDRKKDLSTRSVREEDIKRLEVDLKTYVTLDNTASKMSKVRLKSEDLKKRQGVLSRVSAFISRAVSLKEAMALLKAALTPALPSLVGIQKTSKQAQAVSLWATRYYALIRSVEDLTAALGPALPENKAFPTLVSYDRVSGYYTKLRDKATVIKQLSGVGEVAIPELAGISTSTKRLSEVAGKLASLEAIQKALRGVQGVSEIEVPPKPEWRVSNLKDLCGFSSKYDQLTSSISSISQELEAALKEESEALAEFEELGVCPSCSQTIQPGHALCKVR